jgi:hypothetical protein
MNVLTRVAVLVAPLLASFGSDENTSGAPIPDPPTFETADTARHGWQVADYADRYDDGWKDEIWQGRMELFDANGDSVLRQVLRMLLEGDEGDKSIVRFVSPAEIKGVAALTHEHPGTSDDNWLYLPASKRVRRISGANKTASFQGTEFTYEDLSTLELADYEWRYLEKKGDVHRVEATPNYRDTGYSRLVISYHAEYWRQESIEYYDKAGVHLKTFESGDWRLLHGRVWRSFDTVMVNHQTGKRTTLVFDKVFLNLSLYKSKRSGDSRANLTDEVFTTRSLEGN